MSFKDFKDGLVQSSQRIDGFLTFLLIASAIILAAIGWGILWLLMYLAGRF